jgi:hypothetical protein
MKIAVFITGNEFIRNYLDSDAFKIIQKKAQLTLIINDSLEPTKQQIEVFDNVFKYRDSKSHISTWLYTLYMLKYRSLSSSFRYRARRQFPSSYWQFIYFQNHFMLPRKNDSQNSGDREKAESGKRSKKTRLATKSLRLIGSFMFGKIRKFSFYVAASKPVFWLSSRLLKGLYYKESLHLFLENNFDLILIPTSAYEPIVPRLIHESKKLKIKTILLVDNWDNLSSKSILWEKPDLLACWGKQSISHAVEVQGVNPEKCVAIGTPRIDPYFRLRQDKIPSNFEFPYILFLGSTLPYCEAEFLEKLDKEITTNPDTFLGHKVVYRPHPLRGGWKVVDVSKLRNVIIDPDLATRYQSGALRWNRSGIMPPLRNYPSLLSNSTIIVSGLSSMIFEGTIFWKKCTILAFDEPRNLTNPKRIYNEYIHFKGIEKLQNLTLTFSQAEAIESICNNLVNPIVSDAQAIDENLREFIEFGSDDYATRLSKII